MCPGYKTYLPDAESVQVYETLYRLYRDVYFGFGGGELLTGNLALVLPSLREVAIKARQA